MAVTANRGGADGASSASHASSRSTSPGASNVKARPYSPQPPPWRPLLHPGSSPLGTPDFHPPKAGQPEDDMGEAQVRSGMTTKASVPNEAMSAHGLIFSHLPSLVPTLNTVFGEVLQRKGQLSERSQKLAPHSYKAPPRMTLNDAKLGAYVRDLSDPSVPISRLAKSVPHGFRGERMLEMLWHGGNAVTAAGNSSRAGTFSSAFGPQAMSLSSSTPGQSGPSSPSSTAATIVQFKSVEISRAIWFIRTVGASDISMRSRNAASTSAGSYTSDFTATFTAWLKKQLQELRQLDLSITPEDHPSTLSKDSPTAKWLAKWTYSMALLDALFDESLISERSWLEFVTSAFATASLHQLPVTMACIQQSLPGIIRSALLTRETIKAVLKHRDDLQQLSSPASAFGDSLRENLELVVNALWNVHPEDFIAPIFWSAQRQTLVSILGKGHSTQLIETRARSLLGEHDKPTGSTASVLRWKVIEALDSFPLRPSIVDTLQAGLSSYQNATSTPTAIMLLLEWSTAGSRCSRSPWRPLLAARLVKLLQNAPTNKKRRKSVKYVDTPCDLTGLICPWLEALDGSKTGPEASTAFEQAIVLLSELSRLGLFSYARFLNRAAARELTLNNPASSENRTLQTAVPSQSSTSFSIRLLRALPARDAAPHLLAQRRTVLFGDRQKETYEEATQRRAVRELGNLLHFVNAFETPGTADGHSSMSFSQLRLSLPHLWQASRYTRSRIFTTHIAPAVTKWLRNCNVSSLTPGRLVLLITITAEAEEWDTLAALLEDTIVRLSALADTTPEAIGGLPEVVLDALGAYRTPLSAMGVYAHLQEVFQRAQHSGAVLSGATANVRSKRVELPEAIIEHLSQQETHLQPRGLTDLKAELLVSMFLQETISIALPSAKGGRDQNEDHPLLELATATAADLFKDDASGTLVESLEKRAVLCSLKVDILLALAVTLSILASRNSSKDLSEEVRSNSKVVALSIMRLEHVRDAVCQSPALLSNALREAHKGSWSSSYSAAQLLFGELLDDSLLQRPSRELDITHSLGASLDQWRLPFLVEELGFAFDDLTAVEGAGEQGRANSKIMKCSVALFPILNLGENASLDFKQRLWSTGGKVYRSSSAEAALKLLASHFGASGSSESDHVSSPDVLDSLAFMISHSPQNKIQVSTTDSIDAILSELRPLFASVPVSAIATLLHDHLRTLRVLLRCSAFWSSTNVASGLPDLVTSLFQLLALSSAESSEEEDEAFRDIADTIGYLLEEMPTELLAAASQAIQVHFEARESTLPHEASTPRRAEAFRRLLPFGPASGHAASSMMIGSSLRSALEDGDCSEPPENPWRWAEPLERQMDTAASTTKGPESTATVSDARSDGEVSAVASHQHSLSLPPLANTLSLPLSHFSPASRTTAVSSSLILDFEASQRQQAGFPKCLGTAGVDGEAAALQNGIEHASGRPLIATAVAQSQGWRGLLSERDILNDAILPYDGGGAVNVMDSFTRFGRKSLRRILRDDEVPQPVPATVSDAHSATLDMSGLSQLVGLPAGPVKTMEGHLRSQREKKRKRQEGSSQQRHNSSHLGVSVADGVEIVDLTSDETPITGSRNDSPRRKSSATTAVKDSVGEHRRESGKSQSGISVGVRQSSPSGSMVSNGSDAAEGAKRSGASGTGTTRGRGKGRVVSPGATSSVGGTRGGRKRAGSGTSSNGSIPAQRASSSKGRGAQKH